MWVGSGGALGSGYIALANKKWANIVPGKSIKLAYKFDGKRRWLDEIAGMVSRLRQALDPNAATAFDTGTAYALYQKVLGPVANLVADKMHLIFVLNGALTSLPPQLLVETDPTGKKFKDIDWLIRNHSVSLLPSVSSLKVLRGHASTARAPKPLTGYADPVFNHDSTTPGTRMASRGYGTFFRGAIADVDVLRHALPPLPETADELKAVARDFGVPDSEIMLGAKATETAVKHADLKAYRIVYFATHALVAGDTAKYAKLEAEPAIALSLPDKPTELDDGLLTASEVAQLKLDADWVVLSACNTAAGDKPGADALSGLARAFFYAGARSLLVSNWPVESQSAVALMAGTFDRMAKGAKVDGAEALREAMLAVMNNPAHPDWANPAIWAPFVIVGEPRRE